MRRLLPAIFALFVCATAHAQNGAYQSPSTASGGGGSGTVTSIVTSAPIGGGTITTSGTITCITCAVTSATLAQFAATTSAQLASVISDETGTGLLVFATSPVLTTPNLGTPSAATLTNATGLPAASVLAGALANGMTATTQTVGDNTTKLATDAFVLANSGGSGLPTLPTSPNGVPQSVTSTPSGGVGVAAAWNLSGVPVDATNPATLLVTDRANYLNWTAGTALALPAVSGSFASNLPFVIQNTSTTLTITPNAGASDLIDGSASGTIIPKFASFVYQDGTTAPGHWFTVKFPTFAAFGSNCTTALQWSTTTGISCAANVNATQINGTAFTGTNGNLVSFGAANIPADSGFLATNVVRKDAANTGAAAMTLDMSASTSASALRVANIAGASSTTAGTISYDTTNKNMHVGANGVDNINVVVPSSVTITNNDCVKWSNVASVITLADNGGACGAGGGVTSVGTTGPITGGTITTTGTIACATCVTSAAALTANQAVNGNGSQATVTGFTDTAGTITSGHLACYTASNTIGNCTGIPSNNFIGVFNSSTTWIASGEVSVTLDGTVNVTFGDNLCASSSAGVAHDNGAVACATGEGVAVVKTTASSVSSATAFVRMY